MKAQSGINESNNITLITLVYLGYLFSLEITHFLPFSNSVVILFLSIIVCFILAINNNFYLNKPLIVFISIFWFLMIYLILITFWSETVIESYIELFSMFFPSLLLILIALIDKNIVNTLEKILKLIVIIGTFLSIYGLTIYLWGYITTDSEGYINILNIGGIFEITQRVHGPLPIVRISSLAEFPTGLGRYLMISIPSIIFLMHIKKIKLFNGIIMLILQSFSLYLTYSRASLVSAALIIFLYFLFVIWYKGKLNKLVLSIIFIIIIPIFALLIYNSSIIGNNLLSRFELGLDTTRATVWSSLLSKFYNNPLTGIGFYNSNVMLEREYGAHNFFIGIMVETGLMGLILSLILWIGSIILGLFYILKKNTNLFQMFIVSILISLLFHQLFEFQILRVRHLNFLWIYLIFVIPIISNDYIKSNNVKKLVNP